MQTAFDCCFIQTPKREKSQLYWLSKRLFCKEWPWKERFSTNGWLRHRPTRETFCKQIAGVVCHWKWHETAHKWANKNDGILKDPYWPALYKQRTQDCSIRHHSHNAERPQLSFLCGERRRPRKFEHRSFKNDNKMEFANDLSQVPWSVIDGVESVSDAVFLWERLFSEIANEHALLKIKRAKERKTPWITSTLAEMKRDKDSHFRKARFTNCTYQWKMYRNLRNSTNHKEKNLKSK